MYSGILKNNTLKFKKQIPLTLEEALSKLQYYCAYQERCEKEVVQKLKEYGIEGDMIWEIIELLKAENYLNQQRFAESFVRGKFNYKKWGRVKIRKFLKQKGVNPAEMAIGLAEIDETDYWLTLERLAIEKAQIVKGKDGFDKKQKVYRFLLQKGYEVFLVQEILKTIDFME